MKNRYLIGGILLLLLAFPFISCENEPLTGTFPEGQGPNGPAAGKFKATVAGVEFTADLALATLSESRTLVLKGTKGNGEKINLSVADAALGTFDISWDGTSKNWGVYKDTKPTSLPYASLIDGGGRGTLEITLLDEERKKVSGTFEFVGVRIKMDDAGNPILDGNGAPVMESIDITSGSFTSLSYTIVEDEDEGGGDGDTPLNEFFAKVDGVGFIPESITVTEPINADVHMVKIEALNAENEFLRIDIPKALGVGTFNMENLSDGTKLIALYRDNRGGENLTSNPGKITITEFDLIHGVLKATFQFTGKDPLGNDPRVVKVKEGNFTVYFEGVPQPENLFTANIDGNPYAPETIEISMTVVNQYPRVNIVTNDRDRRMTLSFPATITEGAFDMGEEVILGNEIVGTYYPIDGVSIPYVSQTGTIEITSYDYLTRIIEGTFSFTAVDATGLHNGIYEITSGEFLAILP
ncbi:hypothetical protein EI546_02050 [Aequorivita sp. H23M31]|uniref:Uncharacterized protein n=1 Tax=Aequorivita ciconiae TaxID=2494375 RepID=A0A410FZY9_9FLAO|nr:DUF6252 family protein [Aequorivita sp. H23M31]QAA80585.1 hypothetical protein EI546_02050 [Aequorivita sp. H23M31]